MIKGHGNDIHNFKGKIKADFSSNIWFEGPQDKLTQYISEQVKVIGDYPEPDARSLSCNIEKHFGLEANQCLVTNGSAEAFYLIAQAFQNKSATIFTPSFSEYEDACTRFACKQTYIDNGAIFPGLKFKTDMVWLGNPNNPDGKVTSKSTIEHWLLNNPQTTFIVDEAYAELCLNFESSTLLLHGHQNLVVIKSFTKTFAIPGIRLGFMLGSKSCLKQVAEYCIPWSVNALAIEAGSFILENYDVLIPDVSTQLVNSLKLQGKLNEIDSLCPIESSCNYFLVQLQKGNASQLKDYLIKKHGILIRNASNFRGLDPSWFRVSLQEENSNNLLINALNLWTKQL